MTHSYLSSIDSAPQWPVRVFPPEAASVPAARHFLRECLEPHVAPDVVGTAELLVSELVTNAVVHAGSVCFLHLETDRSGMMRVAVEDSALKPPEPRQAGTGDANGRGLALVEMLASEWGHYPVAAGGKVVWFSVPEG